MKLIPSLTIGCLFLCCLFLYGCSQNRVKQFIGKDWDERPALITEVYYHGSLIKRYEDLIEWSDYSTRERRKAEAEILLSKCKKIMK